MLRRQSARVLRQTSRTIRRAALCTRPGAARPGFSMYKSGLQFRDVYVPEAGRVAEDGDLLSLHYTGRLEDGTLFDTSLDDSLKGNQPEFEGIPSEALLGWDRGHPLQFTLSCQEVIAGWDEGVHGMRVGGRRELIVPPELGYGEAGGGDKIPPNAVLHFEIELLDVRDGEGLFGRLVARFNQFVGSTGPVPRSSANFKPEDTHMPLNK
mmetsp:Transcript_22430/g.45785  ORF Transcript_22430/g.45785 Transcript_22430/m.45785 type:complete len:209 (-) Transcript_22430:22-648(-)